MKSRFMDTNNTTVMNPIGQVRILPIPYNATTTFVTGTGARSGPEAIIESSARVETFDEELAWDSTEFMHFFVEDAIPFNIGSVESMMGDIQKTANQLLATGDFLFSLGGEHSISVPLVKAHLRRYPDLHVIQIDAHPDVLDSQHQNRNSHGCITRRVLELGVPVTQIGIRIISAEEYEFLNSDHGFPLHTFMASFLKKKGNFKKLLQHLTQDIKGPVYLNVDVDGIDPSVIPATGEPGPGGLTWYEMLEIIHTLSSKQDVVGADMVEFAPIPGLHYVDFAAAKLCYKIISHIYYNRWKSNGAERK